MIEEPVVDVAAVVREIETEVAKRRREGLYPEELLSRLRAEFAIEEELEPPEALLTIISSRPLRSDRPGGRLVVFGKRLIRRCLAWYVHPIADDQTRFNTAITRELRALEQRLERVETRGAGGDGGPAPPS